MWQFAVLYIISCLFDPLILLGGHLRIMGFQGLGAIPLYYTFKRRNLRNAVITGHIPTYTAAWNATFFGPKGLSVGFDLPGPVFADVPVHPRPRLMACRRAQTGQRMKAMSARKAAKRARITIVRVTDPVPAAGRVPRIVPLRGKMGYVSLGERASRLVSRAGWAGIRLKKKCTTSHVELEGRASNLDGKTAEATMANLHGRTLGAQYDRLMTKMVHNDLDKRYVRAKVSIKDKGRYLNPIARLEQKANERRAVIEALIAQRELLVFRREAAAAEGKTGSDGKGSVGILGTGARAGVTVVDVSKQRV